MNNDEQRTLQPLTPAGTQQDLPSKTLFASNRRCGCSGNQGIEKAQHSTTAWLSMARLEPKDI